MISTKELHLRHKGAANPALYNLPLLGISPAYWVPELLSPLRDPLLGVALRLVAIQHNILKLKHFRLTSNLGRHAKSSTTQTWLGGTTIALG
jgi:hypothetical protein